MIRNRKLQWVLVVILCASLGSALAFSVHAPVAATTPTGGSASPGVAIASSISTITGVAISPLLGASVVGAWQWFRAPSDQKASLPWYAHPWFWMTGLVVAGLAASKDIFGTATPPGLKKPADVAEVVENKVSALVVGGAMVPLIASVFKTFSAESATLDLGGMGFAAINFAPLLNIVLAPVAFIAFVLVWLASHTINVLIILSPWGPIDAALKAARTFLLSSVVVTSLVNPFAGAIYAVILVLIAYFLAGWSFRLFVCGSVFAWDFLTFRRKRFKPDPLVNWAFTAQKIAKTPIRTYGKLTRTAEGRFVLAYRPWLFLKERTLELPADPHAVGRGFINPQIVKIEDDETKAILSFPPRYRTHEEELGRLYKLDVQDVGLLRGFKAAWRWLKELFGFSPPPQTAVA